jgi:hypothetical protein
MLGGGGEQGQKHASSSRPGGLGCAKSISAPFSPFCYTLIKPPPFFTSCRQVPACERPPGPHATRRGCRSRPFVGRSPAANMDKGRRLRSGSASLKTSWVTEAVSPSPNSMKRITYTRGLPYTDPFWSVWSEIPIGFGQFYRPFLGSERCGSTSRRSRRTKDPKRYQKLSLLKSDAQHFV